MTMFECEYCGVLLPVASSYLWHVGEHEGVLSEDIENYDPDYDNEMKWERDS